MWRYEKRLQYPVKDFTAESENGAVYYESVWWADGEMGASMRYLSQRYAMPYDVAKASLTDIGTEELAHLEIVAAIVHQLTRNLTPQEIEDSGFGPYYIDHTTGIWPQAAGGIPFNASVNFQSKGRSNYRFIRGPRCRTESTEHLRQHPPCSKRSGSM